MKQILLILIGLSTLSLADFTRNGDIVTDNTTRLQWQDDAVGMAVAWESAIARCENLTLGGYSDWRLPNLNELKSIVDRSKYDPAIKEGFNHTSSSLYWSSTTYEAAKYSAWIVYFGDGFVSNSPKGNNYYVRCVRGGE